MILAEFSTNQIEHVCPLEKQRFLVQSNQFKEFIKRSLVDDGFDQKTFQAMPISIIPLRKLCIAHKSQLLLWLEYFNCSVSCLKVVFQVYSIWVPQGIKSVPCPYPGDRICRHNQLIVSAPKSPTMPTTRIYFGNVTKTCKD